MLGLVDGTKRFSLNLNDQEVTTGMQPATDLGVSTGANPSIIDARPLIETTDDSEKTEPPI